jgi:hypothetical protein
MIIRLLEVSVEATEPTRWKLSVMDGATEIACGYKHRVRPPKLKATLHCLHCYQKRLPNLDSFGRASLS